MKFSPREALCGVGLLCVGIASATHAGCAGDTGSKRFAFQAEAGGAERLPTTGPLTFKNERGWVITLTKADITLGPVYLNIVPPLRDTAQGLFDLFVKRAWAHGESHLDAGRIVGEVLGQVTFSALSSDLVPFPVRGAMTQEEVRTAEVWFYPEPGVASDSTKIDTVALDVAGEATRDAMSVRFRGALVLDDAWIPDAQPGQRGALSIAELRKVRGIPSAFFPCEGGVLEIRVDVTRFFRGADFANLADNPSDEDGTKMLVQSKTGRTTTDQVMTNLYQGLHDAYGTYAIRWVGP